MRKKILRTLSSGCLVMSIMSSHAGAVEGDVIREAVADLPERYIYYPSDLAKRKVPAPVIVWANGGCSRNDQDWLPLYEHWAKAGYVVLTVSEPGAKPRTREVFESYRRMSPPRPMPQSDRPSLPPGELNGSAKAAVDFQSSSIDWVIGAAQTKGSIFAGKISTTKIAAAGNSCGGISSLHLASRDPRVKSVYVLSGSANPNGSRDDIAVVLGKVTAPSLWIVGGPEDIARKNAEIDYDVMKAGTPAVLMRRVSYDHPQMTFEPSIRKDAAEIGVAWFDATLRNDKKAARTVVTKGCADCDSAVWTIESKNFIAKR